MVLFAVIDIIGNIPIIIDLRQKVGHVQSGKASLIAGFILIIFLFIGEQLLSIIGIDVHSFAVAGAEYSGDSTKWDLHLYDIQTFTVLQISNTGTNIQTTVPESSRVRGLSSGAIGYVSGHNPAELILSQTTGSFIQGEQLIFNEETKSSNSSVSPFLTSLLIGFIAVYSVIGTSSPSLMVLCSSLPSDSLFFSVFDTFSPNVSQS